MRKAKHGGFLQNILLAVLSVTLIFFLLEGVTRLVMLFDDNYYDMLANHETELGGALTLADIIQLHGNDRIVYELKPDIRGTFLGKTLAINSLGMRDPERSLHKKPGVFRIVGLGDSHTFGWGINQEDTYLARLESLLTEKYPRKAFEVMNLGVPGYNAVQEVQAFSEKVDELSPNMVVVNYVNNDMDLPNFLASRPDPLTLRRFFFLELLRRRFSILKGSDLLPTGLTHTALDEISLRHQMPVEQIPEQFRPLYGWDNLIGAYRRLAEIARNRDIPYLLLFNMDDYRLRLAGKTPTVLPNFVEDLVKLCQEEGYIIVDPQDRIAEYLQKNGLGTTAIWITESDSHSNPLRHGFIADELVEVIEKEGIVLPE